jgi:bacteriocin biosynthesis cyclodehydratase domain-containing protein
LEILIARLPSGRQAEARNLVSRLYGERVLTYAPVQSAHQPGAAQLHVDGHGRVAEALRSSGGAGQGSAGIAVAVLAQDNLDFDEALRFNCRCLQGAIPWFWVTCAPQSRAYVSPAFLPDAGPCLACLLAHFERLSPVPEIYRDLIEHARKSLPISPALFPPAGVALLRDLLLWKADLLEREDIPSALFRLHVLETASLEVSTHQVFIDPECKQCRSHR